MGNTSEADDTDNCYELIQHLDGVIRDGVRGCPGVDISYAKFKLAGKVFSGAEKKLDAAHDCDSR